MASTLAELRRARGLTQAEWARRARVRQATVSAIEAGAVQPRRATSERLASALEVTVDELLMAVAASRATARHTPDSAPAWRFMAGLDPDLAAGLRRELVARWTHTSTAIEGNTLTLADTMFVLSEGLTVAGKSLAEHAEVQGHARAIDGMGRLCVPGARVVMNDIHVLHRAVQTSIVVDAYAPIGAFKIQPNGTTALRTHGDPIWHDYALPHHVPALMDQWLAALRRHVERCDGAGASTRARTRALAAYTELHLGFVAIHPYADGNGRMARLLANVPVLRAGLPPILIDTTERRRYLTLAGDVSLSRGAPVPGTLLVRRTAAVARMRELFAASWQSTLDLVDAYHTRQAERPIRTAQPQ